MKDTIKPIGVGVAGIQELVARLTHEIYYKAALTAVGMAVSHRGHQIALATAGHRRHKGNVPVTNTDKWHIGSVTKSITATLIARLADAGALTFSSTLPDLLPASPMHGSWENCKLEQLLTHTACLPANFPLKAQKIWPDNLDTLVSARRTLIEAALAKPSRGQCGSKFSYSNVGYAIAGHIAEMVAGKAYESLVGEYVFEPLNLSNAGFGAPMGQSPDDQPMGHRTLLGFRKTMDPFEGRADNGPAISAAGRAHMNLTDLLAFGDAHLLGELSGHPLLKPETWQRLHTPNLNEYACGWVRYERDWADGTVLWHNGSNTMWYTLLMLLPKKEGVLAFVTNEGSIRKAERAFLGAAEQLCGALPN